MTHIEPRTSPALNAAAEAVGTFLLVFAGTAVATSAVLNRPIAGASLNSLAVGLTFGLVLPAIVASLGHVSGAHVNPAVTIALASARKLPWRYVPFYLAAQLTGAMVAALCVWGMFGDAGRATAALGATLPTPTATLAQVFLAEFLITFVLVFTIFAVATDERANTTTAALAIGFALGVAVLIGGPVSGGAANPARALGPMIVAAKFTGWWLYIIAPILGGLTAGLLYDRVLRRVSAPKPQEETTVLGKAA
jgi:MIP family channel proteins